MANNMTKKEYQDYVDKKSPKSPIWSNMLKAFLIGGTICTIGQVLLNLYEKAGLEKTQASATVSMTMVFLGALLTGLNLYDNIAKHAGAGTLVPITGFANSIVSPAMEFKAEGYVLGVGAKMFTIAGPVIVYGVISSVVAGLIYFIIH